VVSVAGFIASLKMALMVLLSDTSVARSAGIVEITVGAVMSELPPPSCPLLHPATKATSSNMRNNIFEYLLYLFIFVPSLRIFFNL
jgi:hypothetical protein